MADIFRDPLFVSRREVAPVLALAVVTCLGMPKTLRPDEIVSVQQQYVQQSVPERRQIYAETSRGMPLELRTVVAAPAPFVVATYQPPARPLWQPESTARSIPKTLYADRVLPFATATAGPPARPIWQPADVSQGKPAVLSVVAAPTPFVQTGWEGQQKPQWQPADASQSAYALLYTVVAAPLPIGTPLQLPPPQRYWNVIDTSRPSPQVALDGAQPIVVVTPPDFVPPPAQAGKLHRRRIFIEIDGETFEVSTPEQAQDLLEQAAESAQQTATVAAQEALVRAKGRAPKVKVPRISITAAPGMSRAELSPMRQQVDATRAELERVYTEALAAATAAAIEQDDEDVILALLSTLDD